MPFAVNGRFVSIRKAVSGLHDRFRSGCWDVSGQFRGMVKLRVMTVVYLVDHLATGWRLERFFRARKHPPATSIANSSRFTQQTR